MRTLLFLLAAGWAAAAPAVVTIERSGAGFRLLRDGQPYFVKGAVGARHLDVLQDAGGNSIRANPQALDDARRRGFSVLVNLPAGKQRQGFDYGDAAAVRKQLDTVRDIVRRHKDHPAVLMWAIGNELEIFTTPEQRGQLWKGVNDIATAIHELDPNHPVITVVGSDFRRWNLLAELKEQAPALDAIGLNAYADMLTMPEDVARQGWDKPYIVTEFGPVGHWQVPKTEWRSPIEQTSTQKAEFYLKAYKHAVSGQSNCLGSYVFHWSQHHEKTHTWYGMFLEDGSRTEAVDVMTLVWTGKYPENRSPRLPSGIELTAEQRVFPAGSQLEVEAPAEDPDGDELSWEWDLRVDVADNPNVGGDREESTPPIRGAVVEKEDDAATIALPAKAGKYRIFVYVRDGRGNAATANVPILVQ